MPLFITDYPTQVTASAAQPVYITGTINTVPGTGTQTVTGSVTANIGTTNGLMLDTTFTGRINTLGAKTTAASTPVTLPTDPATFPVGVASGSLTSVGSITNGVGINSGTLTTVGTVTTVSTITNLASGTVTIRTTGSIPVEVIASSATGSAFPSQAMAIAGNNSGTLRAVNVDAAGNMLIAAQTPITVAQATAANLNTTTVQGNAGTNAQAWWTRIGDATNGPAAVKAASTAAAASDPALVVSVSPNSIASVKEVRSTSASISTVSVNTSSTVLLGSAATRYGAALFNTNTSATVFVGLGGTGATTSLYSLKLGPGAYLEMPSNFTGLVTGIVASGAINVNVTDFSA